MREPAYRSSVAASLLDISAYHMRRLCETGQVDADRTEGGHWRVTAAEVERLKRQGVPPIPAPENEPESAGAPRKTMAEPDPVTTFNTIDAEPQVLHERVQRAAVRNRLERRKTEFELEVVEDQFRARERQARAEQEEQQRQLAEATRNAQRAEWEREWIERALDSLRWDCPAEFRPEVANAVRKSLEQFNPSYPSGVVQKIMEGAVESALKPYRLQQRREAAIKTAIADLPYMRNGQAEYETQAKKLAIRALNEIGDCDQATLDSLAKLAVQPIKTACALAKKRAEIVAYLPLRFSGHSKEETEQAEKAVTNALDSLPANANPQQMQEAADAILARHEQAAASRRAAQALVQQGLQCLDGALNKYEWESYFDRLKAQLDLHPMLQTALSEAVEDAEVNLSNVREWVTEWVENQLEEEEDEGG